MACILKWTYKQVSIGLALCRPQALIIIRTWVVWWLVILMLRKVPMNVMGRLMWMTSMLIHQIIVMMARWRTTSILPKSRALGDSKMIC